ncbi:MAG: hypothetical protein JNJ99_06995, partial [Crocinitomicaceae bacterium]|nr:hypothetical protein [Crocinitomicaceae bacterium]
MKSIRVLSILILLVNNSTAQTISSNQFQSEFQTAYSVYPNIPKGLLEGVAYAQTRIEHLTGNHQGCVGLPQVSGVMGMTENGQGYFEDNLIFASQVSGFSIN